MKFCNVCDNMLYFKINVEEEDKGKTTLLYYCRKCGEIENIDELELIKDITYEKKTNINININKNIKHDPVYENGQKGGIVELFGWPHNDVKEECAYLA